MTWIIIALALAVLVACGLALYTVVLRRRVADRDLDIADLEEYRDSIERRLGDALAAKQTLEERVNDQKRQLQQRADSLAAASRLRVAKDQQILTLRAEAEHSITVMAEATEHIERLTVERDEARRALEVRVARDAGVPAWDVPT